MDYSILLLSIVALRSAVLAAAEPSTGGGWNAFVPIITAVIVLIGTIAGLVFNRMGTNQRLAFERAQWEAAQAEAKRKEERESERAAEERERAHAAAVQEAVRRECGECMESVRRLMADLDAATNRLLAVHELVGQRDARIAQLEADLAAERRKRKGPPTP